MKYISRIQAKLKRYQTIHTNRKTDRVLDGSYKSVFKGRSMNFDELREYVPGDNVHDIDWKASVRSQRFLVRQYIAEKKHNVMLVFDTNRRMLADTPSGEEKREVGIMAAGMLAYFVHRNGDFISSTFCTKDSIDHYPFKTGLGNIEMILEKYHRTVTMGNESDINRVLKFITRNFKRKMIVIVVTDLQGIASMDEANIKHMLVGNDVLLINVNDVEFWGKKTYSMDDEQYLPAFLSEDKRLNKKAENEKKRIELEATEKLHRMGITSVSIDSTENLELKIMDLLKRHRLEKR